MSYCPASFFSIQSPAIQVFSFVFFHDTAPTEIYTLSLHDALPIARDAAGDGNCALIDHMPFEWRGPRNGRSEEHTSNSSHLVTSYAVFCLKKKTEPAWPRPAGVKRLQKSSRSPCVLIGKATRTLKT